MEDKYTLTNSIIADMQRIENKYDGDNDLVPGQPQVLWVDMQLAEAIKQLTEIVQSLQNQIQELSK